MYLGNVWGLTMLFVGLVTSLVVLQLLFDAVWPGLVGRARTAAATRPVRCGLVGGVVLVLSILGLAVGGQIAGAGGGGAGVIRLFLLLFAFAVTTLALAGWAGVSREIGERMATPGSPPWRATLRGAVTSTLAAVVPPVIGWFAVLPVCLAVGTGAAIFGIFASRSAKTAMTATIAPAAAARD